MGIVDLGIAGMDASDMGVETSEVGQRPDHKDGGGGPFEVGFVGIARADRSRHATHHLRQLGQQGLRERRCKRLL